MPGLQKRFAIIGCWAAIACASSMARGQESKSPPADSADPYFRTQRAASKTPLKPLAEPAAADMLLADPAKQPDDGPAKKLPAPAEKQNRVQPQATALKIVGGTTSSSPATPSAKSAEAPTPKFASSMALGELDSESALPLSQAGQKAKRDSIQKLAQETPPASSQEQFEPGRVLAIVGGRPILVGDILYEVNEMIEQHARSAPETIKQAQRQELVPRMLPKFIDHELMYVDTVRGLPEGADIDKITESLGKTFDEEALPKILEKSGVDSPLKFDAQLRAMSSSLRQYRQAWINDQFMKYFVSQKLNADEEISLKQLRDYYDQHVADFQFPAKARWEQLEVRFDRVPDRKAARRMISEMGNQVVFGAPLDAVAKQHSHDLKAEQGGQQGWVTKGSLAADALDKAIFEIPLNELSDVIETPTGFHIIRVLERTSAGAKPFRDAQVQIKEKLSQAQREKKFEDYITKLRREIPIEVVDQSVKLPEKYLLR
jgi:hypothetical protein